MIRMILYILFDKEKKYYNKKLFIGCKFLNMIISKNPNQKYIIVINI